CAISVVQEPASAPARHARPRPPPPPAWLPPPVAPRLLRRVLLGCSAGSRLSGHPSINKLPRWTAVHRADAPALECRVTLNHRVASWGRILGRHPARPSEDLPNRTTA